MWYAVLNHVNPKEALVAFNLLIGLALEDGYDIESLVRSSEKVGGVTQALCYDALVKGGQKITPEQEQFLKDHPWQKQFWG